MPLGTSAIATADNVASPTVELCMNNCVPFATTVPLATGIVPAASENSCAPVTATAAPTGSLVVTVKGPSTVPISPDAVAGVI